MTHTTMIVLNAVLAAVVLYAVHHLLVHGIRAGRFDHREVATPQRMPEAERRAA